MPADAFRPRSISELLDAAIQLLRAHYSGFLALSAIALVPQIAVSTYQLAVLTPQYADGSMLYVLLLPLMTVAILWFVIGDAALVVAASDAYLGGGIEPRKAFRQALRRSGTVVGSAILKYLFISIGLVLLGAMIPVALAAGMTVVAVLLAVAAAWWALFMVVRLFAYRVSIMLEGLGAFASLRRSWGLSRGDALKILLAFILLYVIYAAVWLLAFTIAFFASGHSKIIAQSTASVIVMFFYPLIPIVMTLLYYDLRIRKEGYDIELMAGELDSGLGTRDPGLGTARGERALPDRGAASPEPRVPTP